MSTTTTNFGWTVPSDTDLVKDGAAAIRTALGGVDTSFVDLKGGTTGQVLSKASGTDLDFTWVAQDDSNAIQNAIVDAKGDLIAATGADTPARLPVGTNGQILTADSTASTGLAWATPAGGSDFVRIATSTFTSSTGINFNSVFSSTYKNYVIKVNITAASSGNVRARLRSGTTDNTNSTYFSSLRYSRIDGSNDGINKQSASSSWILTDINGGWGSQTVNVYLPYETAQTVMGTDNFFYAYASGDNYYLADIAGTFNATTSFDGITIYPGGGTISGEISIYGLKRS